MWVVVGDAAMPIAIAAAAAAAAPRIVPVVWWCSGKVWSSGHGVPAATVLIGLSDRVKRWIKLAVLKVEEKWVWPPTGCGVVPRFFDVGWNLWWSRSSLPRGRTVWNNGSRA